MNENIENAVLKEATILPAAELQEGEMELVLVDEVPSRLVGNSENAEIIGDGIQVAAMMEDWSKYMGEVENPAKNTDNAYLKSTYAALDSVLNATRPVLSKYGLGITQYPVYKVGEGMKVTTILTHRSGAYIVYPAMTIPLAANADAQKIVAASTYGRRATANAILGVHGESDDDGNSLTGAKAPSTKKSTKASATSDELANARKKLLAVCTEKVKTVDKEKVYAVIESVAGSKNPNSCKTVDDCNKAIKLVEELK